MKSPDEIKKGLECCLLDDFHCGEGCPYKKICLIEHRYNEIDYDALAYIQQLESENAEKDARIQQLEAERDAAVRDLTEMAQDTDESCEYCEMFKTQHCSLECRMKNKGFKWRGVQKEDSDA